VNFAGVAGVYTREDIFFDPVLRLEDVEMDRWTLAFKYIRTFRVAHKSARIEAAQAFHWAQWKGLLDGNPAQTERQGPGDPVLRLALNLVGAPPLKGKEFSEYRAKLKRETIVGAALAVHLPLGEYQEDKFLNLGGNRFVIRPQLGLVHGWGKWSAELTGSIWCYTRNDDFYNGLLLEQEPLFTVQGHLVYTFRPGLWIGGGVGYGYGARSTLNGEPKDDRKENLSYGIGVGYSLSRNVGLKLAYTGVRAQARTGADVHAIALAMSVMW